jgi:hypothetical protein
LLIFLFTFLHATSSLPELQPNAKDLLDLMKTGGKNQTVDVNKKDIEESLNEKREKREADHLTDLMENGGETKVVEINKREAEKVLQGTDDKVNPRQKRRSSRETQKRKPKRRRPSKSSDEDEDEKSTGSDDDDQAKSFAEFWKAISKKKDKKDDVKTDLEKNMKPMTCVLKKFNNIKFLGTLTGIAKNIDSEDLCGGICYQFNFEGGKCKSVNYIKASQKCELMSDVFDAKGPMSKYVKYYVEISQNSLYVIPTSCKQEGEKPKPIPKTNETTAFNANMSLSGSCGKTLFPNRVGKSSSSSPSTRIVGGTEARPHSMPWIGSLQENGSPFCGGSLIRCDNSEKSSVFLTAAHCIKQPGRWTDLNPNDLTVNLGEHSLSNPDKGEQKMKVEKFEIHSQYDEDTSANDIAVVQLKTPVSFSDTIRPVCLPDGSAKMPAPGTRCVVAGWGTTAEGGRQSDKLMQVFSPIISEQDCTSAAFYGSELHPDKMFCAGYKEGSKDSCQGDSGGPYVCYDGDVALLYGVVSFGIGCAREAKPGVYTKVINYRPWIEQMKSKYCR